MWLTDRTIKISAGLTLFCYRQILLARQGFDTEKLTQNLSSIDLKTTFEPLESISETDLESYLKHEHELIVLSAIEEAKKEVM